MHLADFSVIEHISEFREQGTEYALKSSFPVHVVCSDVRHEWSRKRQGDHTRVCQCVSVLPTNSGRATNSTEGQQK